MKIMVWDWPTRLFHGLLVVLFFAAFAIAISVDDETPIFRYHMVLGLIAAFLVLCRVVWGVVGSRYARFSSFLYGPGEVLAYFRGVLGQGANRSIGHNAGSSYAIFAMLALPLALAGTGMLLSNGSEFLEEMHEVLAFSMLAIVFIHIAGVVWHVFRHKENIILSMIDGRKSGESSEAIPSSHPLVAIILLVLLGLWSFSLYSGLDQRSGTLKLPLFGVQIQLGESEHEEGHEKDHEKDHEKGHYREHRHEKDDDRHEKDDD